MLMVNSFHFLWFLLCFVTLVSSSWSFHLMELNYFSVWSVLIPAILAGFALALLKLTTSHGLSSSWSAFFVFGHLCSSTTLLIAYIPIVHISFSAQLLSQLWNLWVRLWNFFWIPYLADWTAVGCHSLPSNRVRWAHEVQHFVVGKRRKCLLLSGMALDSNWNSIDSDHQYGKVSF